MASESRAEEWRSGPSLHKVAASLDYSRDKAGSDARRRGDHREAVFKGDEGRFLFLEAVEQVCEPLGLGRRRGIENLILPKETKDKREEMENQGGAGP